MRMLNYLTKCIFILILCCRSTEIPQSPLLSATGYLIKGSSDGYVNGYYLPCQEPNDNQIQDVLNAIRRKHIIKHSQHYKNKWSDFYLHLMQMGDMIQWIITRPIIPRRIGVQSMRPSGLWYYSRPLPMDKLPTDWKYSIIHDSPKVYFYSNDRQPSFSSLPHEENDTVPVQQELDYLTINPARNFTEKSDAETQTVTVMSRRETYYQLLMMIYEVIINRIYHLLGLIRFWN